MLQTERRLTTTFTKVIENSPRKGRCPPSLASGKRKVVGSTARESFRPQRWDPQSAGQRSGWERRMARRSGGSWDVEWRCPFCVWALVALRKLLSLLPAHLNRATPTAPGRSFWNNDVNCLPAFVSFTLALPLSSACYSVPSSNHHSLYLSKELIRFQFTQIPTGLLCKPPIVLMVPCVQCTGNCAVRPANLPILREVSRFIH